MNVLLPRLGRPEVDAILDRLVDLPVAEIAAEMPIAGLSPVYAPVGGARADSHFMLEVRGRVVALATELGYPGGRDQEALHTFDTDCAYLLHRELGITPHEAGHREVWACLTAAYLLDVAAWRWGGIRDRNRANGDVNRDTFRRLWWRTEVLHDPELPWDGFGGLGEDEIVAIMERPGVAGNPEVARAIVRGFRARLDEDPSLIPARMNLMRDAMKRLTRLTPFLMLDVIGPTEVDAVIEDLMREASGAVAKTPVVPGQS
jgi:Family of unknown function (DUF6339)